jgi:uncharacterized protein YdaU (DUF1376 family)
MAEHGYTRINQGRQSDAHKLGRGPYVRLWPDRIAFLQVHLDAVECFAYSKLLAAFVVSDGNLPDDNKTLAKVSGLPPKRWLALREKLIARRLCRADGGLWIDDDQLDALNRYRAFVAQRSGAAKSRWKRELVLVEPPKVVGEE